MNKKNIGLRAAHSANNIVELHAATESSTVKNDELSAKLVAGRSRREHALKSSSNLDKALSALQERYVVCAEPPAIYDLKLHKPLKEQGFKLYHRSPKFRPPEGDKKRALGEIFLDHPDTTRCSCLSFRPGRPTIDGDFLNLWTPPDIHEVEGDISPFIEHMDYVFDGQQESINYALDWMALPLQKPGSKMDSAILLVGKQGTGKTTLGEICRRSHGLSNSAKIKGEDLLKDFNDYTMKATFVSVEEVFLKGRWVRIPLKSATHST